MMYAAPLAGVLSAVIIVTLIALDAWLEDCSFLGSGDGFRRLGFRMCILATDLNRVALQLFALIQC